MAVELARKFQKLQEERTQTFHQLDQHHKIFLCHAPEYEKGFDDFKKGVSQATDRFKEISQEIIKIKESLNEDQSSPKLGSMIGKVQDLEEKKLNTVVDLQLARQQALDNPGDELCEKNADLIKAGLVKLEEQITETLTEIRYEVVDIDPPA
eukprot:TRINITY_DN6354_c0_g1_i1.p1 TRINITY_DN6354_c0_g1~~TRINITY_DN6354_c0_g1_i1.p1  ORF type:complete len:152 (-),score=64.30 TRINITY_DN6354_c0_g1_i1:68-523(-)